MSVHRTSKTSAFGVEEGLPTYRLRQARYFELACDVSRWALEQFEETRRPLDLLDVGCANGISMRYIEPHAGFRHVRFHGADLFPKGMDRTYKHEQWQLKQVNLEHGLTGYASNRYDVVICEQVLEHLHGCEPAITELVRVLRPGGMLVVGVPIFAFGAHLVRKHVVPAFDRLIRSKRERGHVQAFSKRSFVRLLKSTGQLEVEQVRGFRFISGGPLRPLEYCRWWWRLNRRLGQLAPSLCTEIQILARKRAVSGSNALKSAA